MRPRHGEQLDPIRTRRLGGGSLHEHVVPHVLAAGGHLGLRQGAEGDGLVVFVPQVLGVTAGDGKDGQHRRLVSRVLPRRSTRHDARRHHLRDPLGDIHAQLCVAESVTGSRAEGVDHVLTLTQLHGGLVGDFTNPLEVGIQLAVASLYAADGRVEPEGVPGSRRQRVGPFLKRRGRRRNLWVATTRQPPVFSRRRFRSVAGRPATASPSSPPSAAIAIPDTDKLVRAGRL